jgi:hypothetical protein
LGCICLRVQSPFGVSITCMRVCVRACVATSCGFGPFEPTPIQCRAAGVVSRARGLHGRYISSTKLKALPEWLGQCTLLYYLCVPPRRPAAVRVCGGAGAKP